MCFFRCSVIGCAIALLLGLPNPPTVAGASVGINATHIVIGQTGPFTGLQAAYGPSIAAGLHTAFEEANAAGGIRSRNLTLLSLDDGYQLNRSIANFATLANETLLLASVYGSDINAALLPLMLQEGLPSVGPWTGASVTRSPFHEEFINVRPSYADEMVVHAILLVQRLRLNRIACLYQGDSFGTTMLDALVAALRYVGMELIVAASYPSGSTAVEPALEAIAGQLQPVQAVVMASLEAQTLKFHRLFQQDNRTDSDCIFLLTSVGTTSSFSIKVEPRFWSNLYFTQVVPPLNTPGIDIEVQFQNAAALYMPANVKADPVSFQTYLTGLLIVQVLKGIPREITRKSFLDQLYNTRLFTFGGLLAGLYSRNFTGCEKAICSSNIGFRSIFPATLNRTTGATTYNGTLGYYSYPATELSFPVTNIVRPLLFAQLLPTDDPVWQRVAEAIGQGLQSSFAILNATGGVNGRPVELIQRWYSGDPTPHAAALASRYPLLSFIGSVVNYSQTLQSTVPQIGTYQTEPLPTYSPHNISEVLVQASLPLEIMALASFALPLGLPVHLRAPATPVGQMALQLMVRSLHSLQQRPASSQTFDSAANALQGLSSGALLAFGSDADVRTWFLALADLPQLRLLIPSTRAIHLLGTLNVADHPQARRVHYPYMFSTDSLPAVAVAGPEVEDAVQYGQLLGGVLNTVLANSADTSLAYTTVAQVLQTWYGSQYKCNGVTLGPYYSTACSTVTTNCECNEGVRQVTVLTATRQEVPSAFTYTTPTCRVTYKDLLEASSEGPWYIGVAVGVAGGVAVVGLLSWWLSRHGRRDNATAPKDADEPFCILFTDIQSSTNLWATVPDVMAGALHVHHTLIRKLIARHKLYEVKTIGDSFMCATRNPVKAVEFALALQRELFEHHWGTKAIDTVYLLQQADGKGTWSGSHASWNGLRVRVGIHFGLGKVHLDPVSKGYDYYGTVVNTAARVEAVCHGGQVGITQAVYDALKGEYHGATVTDLGKQTLRGLAEPVHLYQLVPSELSERTFPPLRLEKAAHPPVEVDFPTPRSIKTSLSNGLVVPVVDGHSLMGSPKSWGLSPAARNGAFCAPAWVESHPLVVSGQLTAEDVTLRYFTVQKALTTLLETQTQRVREAALHAFCERLEVRHTGSEGGRLEDTLHSIVQRVLPAALTAACTDHRRASGVSCCMSSRIPQDFHFPDRHGLCPISPHSELPRPVSPLSIVAEDV